MGNRKRNVSGVVSALVTQHGTKHRRDILDGVAACARIWDFAREGMPAFRTFCLTQYVPPGKEKQQLLSRLDHLWREIRGSMMVIRKEARAGLDIADLPLTPAEQLLGSFTVGSHIQEDYRHFKIAHLAQLNFGTECRDVPTTRAAWAERRLGEMGRDYVPAALLAESSQTQAEVDAFVSNYNFYLDQIDFGNPKVTFPKGTRLSSHWGLRDYMMRLYHSPDGFAQQHAIMELMERVVDGKVPAIVLDDPSVRWDVAKGQVVQKGRKSRAQLHGPLRWAQFRKLFRITRKIDPYRSARNFIEEKFLDEREMPEPRVRKVLTDILGSREAQQVGKYLSGRLGRPLKPFDIYYKDFATDDRAPMIADDVAKRYPTRDALQAAIPKILRRLGFDRQHAGWIASKIRVDNGRSAGHAWSPSAMHDFQLLRVRVPKEGVGDMEFETFMHELGHCVEGVLSSYQMDYQCLWGVPNTALTEAFAFTFQGRTDDILGQIGRSVPHLTTIQRFWDAFEIALPALVEIDFFHWLYAHPQATAAQMQRAIRKIGDRLWDQYCARIFGKRSYGLPAVYSHILWCDLYLADYVLGYVAAYQLQQHVRGKRLGRDMPRMCAAGRVYPDEWMKNAVGSPISAKPLLQDTTAALKRIQ